MKIKLTNVLFYKRKKLIINLMRTFLYLFCTTIFAITPGDIFSQNAKIVIETERIVSVDEVFDLIKKQTDYNFIYQEDLFKNAPKVHLKKGTINANELLNTSLSKGNFNFSFTNKNTIVINKVTAVIEQEEITITGKVTDDLGMPISGVNIFIKGNNQRVLTDMNGEYAISVSNNQAVLVYSYLGFTSQETTVGERKQIDITLKIEENELDEIVIVGYGTKAKKGNLQGISAMTAEKITEIPVATLSQSLAGRLPGLFVTAVGGKPGATSKISIRSFDSINIGFSSTSPLFVIDGVILDQFAFDGLDASEVDKISILKDGASSSIYGVRGANGVVLVTTKKGKKGKAIIQFSSSYSIDSPTKLPETLNAYQEGILRNDYIRQIDPNYKTNANYYGDDELEYWKTNSNSLVDKYFKSPSEKRNTLSISGGGDKFTYFLSGATYDGTGTFDNLDYQKINYRANLQAQVTDNLTIGVNLSADVRNDNKPYWRTDYDSDAMANSYLTLLTSSKMASDYVESDGVMYPVGNFLTNSPGEAINGNAGYSRKKWNNYTAILDVTLKIPFIKGLKVQSSYANYSRHYFSKILSSPFDLYTVNTFGSKNHLLGDQIDFSRTRTRNDGDFVEESYTNNESYQFNFNFNYDRKFGQHSITGLLGYEQSETNNNIFGARNQFLISNDLDQLSLGSSDPKDSTVSGSQFEDGRLAGYARITYDYANQYFLESSLRYEGSKYFIPSKRYGAFPSLSAGWRISEASFFKNNVKFINDLKFRVSYGLTGEEPGGNRLQWEQTFRKGNGAVFGGGVSNGLLIGTLPNPDITWAKKKSLNYGLDASMLNNKLNLSVDVFKNRREGIFNSNSQSVPSTFGANFPIVNFGIAESQGFELELGYKTKITQDLSFNSSFNFGYATNKIIQLDEAANIRPYRSNIGFNSDRLFGLVATDIIRNQADLDALPAGYTINGLVPRLGMLNYKDIRGAVSDTPDGKIDDNDFGYIADHTVPPISYGLSIGGKWKGFSIEVLFQGLSKYYKMRENYSSEAAILTQEKGSFAFWEDHWTPENPNAKYPLFADYRDGRSTFFMDDASFIRLKNLNIGYDFPSFLCEQLRVDKIKLFFNGANLFLLQDKIKIYDPESTIRNYPINKNITIGFNVTF